MCEKFVYKHLEKIEYVKNLAYFLRNLQTSRANNSRILSIKNAEFSEYFFIRTQTCRGIFKSVLVYL